MPCYINLRDVYRFLKLTIDVNLFQRVIFLKGFRF